MKYSDNTANNKIINEIGGITKLKTFKNWEIK